jgi:hypothetical protein
MPDRPTTIAPNGDQLWERDGKPHRVNGPAVVLNDGSEQWFLHRTGGPSVTLAEGDRAWYQHGRLHRTDGPAVENAGDVADEWVANGVDLSAADVHFIRKLDPQVRAEVLTLYSTGSRASHIYAALIAART